MLLFHKWKWKEDLVVAVYALGRKTDKKSLEKLARLLNLKENQVAYRMSDYVKMVQGKIKDRHFSKQEKEVYEWLTSNNGLCIKPL